MKIRARRGVCIGVDRHLGAGDLADLDAAQVTFLVGIGAVEIVPEEPTVQAAPGEAEAVEEPTASAGPGEAEAVEEPTVQAAPGEAEAVEEPKPAVAETRKRKK